MNRMSHFTLEAALRVAEANAKYHRERLTGIESLREVHLQRLEETESRIADLKKRLESE